MKTKNHVLIATAVSAALLAGCATTGGGYYGSNPPPQQQTEPNDEGMNRTQRGALIGAAVPGARKAVKWNSPFYGPPGQGDAPTHWFLSIHCFDRYIKVAFFRGQSLDPPSRDWVQLAVASTADRLAGSSSFTRRVRPLLAGLPSSALRGRLSGLKGDTHRPISWGESASLSGHSMNWMKLKM